MLETSAEYCPAAHVPFGTAIVQTIVAASYDGVACAPAMECHIRYTLDWETSAPGIAPGQECVAPPTPAPTPAPSISPTEDGVAGNESEGGSEDEDEDSTDGGSPTPVPATGGGSSSGGDGSNSSGNGGGASGINDDGRGSNYLSRSVVRCAEEWANCTTVEANFSYEPSSGGLECAKLETVIGEVGVMLRGDVGVGVGVGVGVWWRR